MYNNSIHYNLHISLYCALYLFQTTSVPGKHGKVTQNHAKRDVCWLENINLRSCQNYVDRIFFVSWHFLLYNILNIEYFETDFVM